jgi:hypothetical protein
MQSFIESREFFMADPEVKRNPDPLGDALNELADTKAGVTFLTWLKARCFFESSTVVGDPQSHDININGTLFNEAARRVYLDIRRKIKPELRKRIEQ